MMTNKNILNLARSCELMRWYHKQGVEVADLDSLCFKATLRYYSRRAKINGRLHDAYNTGRNRFQAKLNRLVSLFPKRISFGV